MNFDTDHWATAYLEQQKAAGWNPMPAIRQFAARPGALPVMNGAAAGGLLGAAAGHPLVGAGIGAAGGALTSGVNGLKHLGGAALGAMAGGPAGAMFGAGMGHVAPSLGGMKDWFLNRG